MSKRKPQRGPTPPKNRPVGRPRKRVLVCQPCRVVVFAASTPEGGVFYVGHDGRVHGAV